MKLTEEKKQEMIVAYASGMAINAIAKHYGVHRNSVRPIIQAAKRGMQVSQDWREKFNKLPELCVDAIERSVTDRNDVHKAASTAQTHFKGVGVYGADNSVSIKLDQWLGSPVMQRLTLKFGTRTSSDALPDPDAVGTSRTSDALTNTPDKEDADRHKALPCTAPDGTPEELQKESEAPRITEERRIAQQDRAQLVWQMFGDL
jgi:transposase-like protein